ncbi:MAG: STAS domain-containing protein [Bacilli bacterium]|nr:STAS domain-containing protein [Bacilli bacterium]
MNITKTKNGSELLLELDGNLDTSTAPDLNKVINESLFGITSLIIDLENVTYVSSAGLRVLLVAYKTMTKKGSMVVRHVNKDVMDIFSMTGFDSILTIEN